MELHYVALTLIRRYINIRSSLGTDGMARNIDIDVDIDQTGLLSWDYSVCSNLFFSNTLDNVVQARLKSSHLLSLFLEYIIYFKIILVPGELLEIHNECISDFLK